jgi:site-specific DNA recombinase
MSKTSVQPQPDTTPEGRYGIGYIRVSSDAQETQRQEQTIPARHAQLPDGLDALRLELIPDNGISAWSGKPRPGFEETMERVQSGNVAFLIVDTSSRLTRRGIRDALTIFFGLEDANCRLFTTQGREYTFDLGGIISLIADAEADERYSANISYTVSSGKHAIASAGYWPNGPAPTGYNAEGERRQKILVPNAQAPIVIRAFQLYGDEGATNRDVARYLLEELGKADRSFPKRLLKNVAYIGKVRCGEETFDGKHERLIPDELFDRVQRLLAESSSQEQKKRRPRRWPFAGIARCGECGSTLRFRTLRPREDEYRYAVCSHHRFPTRTCTLPSLNADVVGDSVVTYLGAIAHGLRVRLDLDETFAVAEEAKGDAEEARKELERCEEQLDVMTDLVIDRALSKDDERYTSARAARDTAEGELLHITRQGRSYRELIEHFVEDVESFAATIPPQIRKWLQREHVAISVAGTDLDGQRFLEGLHYAWQNATLDEQHAIIERNFAAIVADEEGFELHFRDALPGVLHVPALNAYRPAEAEESVDLYETATT